MRYKMSDIHKLHAHGANIGLGWQSTAMALMFVNGDLPPPTACYFADTGWEREGTYENLQRLKPIVEAAGIPFHVVSGGNIREHQLDVELDRVELPYYCDPSRYETIDGRRELLIKDVKKAYKKRQKELIKKGQIDFLNDISLEEYLEVALLDFENKVEEGIITDGWMQMDVTTLGRQCTQKFKIAPVHKHCRAVYGAHFKTPMGSWLGISTDEWHRMAMSEEKAFLLMYPLIDYGMSREDCKAYLEDHDYPVPVKSSCIGCPYHSDELWREMSDAEIEDVSKFERSVNMNLAMSDRNRDLPYFANGVRVHDSMEPIGSRPFDKARDESDIDRDGVCGAAGCFL